ncbi:glycosyltransferase family 4 protein [Bradyrhizobium guangxiense]|uniref:glycosyltransferase family 4 protein n=1 Tax=Bradyrhizobium guangxiense TaxID=1325115 RepID=UPI0013E8A958|nr:glycosyltransferase family 4 protein [Bradyrhizobium guangxiense]
MEPNHLMSGQAAPDRDRHKDYPYLLLATDSDVQGAYSGYTQLAKHVPHAALLRNRRREPRTVVERAAQRWINQFTGSSWYRFSSVEPELRAWLQCQTGFEGLVHFLWGERDWGVIDRLPSMRRPKVCATFHACTDTLPDTLRANRLRSLDGIILMSETQREFFLNRGVDNEKIEVIPHGIDLSYFHRSEVATSEQFTVLSVGSYRRRFDLLRDVIRIIGSVRPEISFVVVASPDKTRELEGLANVRLLSGVSDSDLRRLYSSSSCLLMTLQAATANNAILEAMACELPIVSEDVGGIREYVGEAGTLVPPGSADALVEAILSLHGDRDLAARIGRVGGIRAKSFDWPIIAERTAAFYRRVLAA